jgi:hypothetical protein
LSDEEIDIAVADDEDEAGMHVDWSTVSVELLRPKAVLNMRFDYNVLEYFRSQGKGYQKKNQRGVTLIRRTKTATKRNECVNPLLHSQSI